MEGPPQLVGQGAGLQQEKDHCQQDHDPGTRQAADVGEQDAQQDPDLGEVEDIRQGHQRALDPHLLQPDPELMAQQGKAFLIGGQAVAQTLEGTGGHEQEDAAQVHEQEEEQGQGHPFGHPQAAQPAQDRGQDDGEKDRQQQGGEDRGREPGTGGEDHQGRRDDQAPGRGVESVKGGAHGGLRGDGGGYGAVARGKSSSQV